MTVPRSSDHRGLRGALSCRDPGARSQRSGRLLLPPSQVPGRTWPV